MRRTSRANDIDGSALAAHPGPSQGRPIEKPGSKPIHNHGLPILRSPREPLRPSHRNLRATPDAPDLHPQFHAWKTISLAAHDSSIAMLEEAVEHYAGGRNIPKGPVAGDGRPGQLNSGID